MNTLATIDRIRATIPFPRIGAESATPVPVEDDALAYLDFLYGFGAGRGIGLGQPQAHTELPTPTGCVFREDFERGIALCNCGEEAAEVMLDRPYYDRAGNRRSEVAVPPKEVVVLLDVGHAASYVRSHAASA